MKLGCGVLERGERMRRDDGGQMLHHQGGMVEMDMVVDTDQMMRSRIQRNGGWSVICELGYSLVE